MKFNIWILLLTITLFACEDTDNRMYIWYCNNQDSPYVDPIWHPSGKTIGFNHIPIKEINYYGNNNPCKASYIYEYDSTGFWLINSDGTDQRRILPYTLTTPSWSPDGKWIAFSKGGQICIMPFDGFQFDTAAIVRLTNGGFPVWNNEGDKIAYHNNGIWIYDLLSGESQSVARHGNNPNWHPFSNTLIYITTAINGDSLWSYDFSSESRNTVKFISSPNYDSRYFSYSPDGNYITFISTLYNGEGIQLFMINSDGSDFKNLTEDGCVGYSWSPDDKIVYVNYNCISNRIDEEKGTLWVMDSDGNNKTQLTRNIIKVIQ